MRLVAKTLLILALGSIQLPWVICGEACVHLDLGAHDHDHGHDHGDANETESHEPLEWKAVARPFVAQAPIAFTAILVESSSAFPDVDATVTLTEARAVAPPIAALNRTTVLLL